MADDKELKQAEKMPNAYQSGYNNTINSLLSRIGQKREYDFNTDPAYQAYKKQYSELAATGAQNAVNDTNALSGGYGTTYANASAGQANQQYMAQMNSIIPSLYEAAMSKYDAEQEAIVNEFGIVNQEESNAYERHRDTVSDAQTDRDYAYNKYQDAVSNEQWQKEYDYQKSRDAVSDEQWQKEFDEDVREYDLNNALQKASASSSGSSGSSKKKSSSSSSSDSDAGSTDANTKTESNPLKNAAVNLALTGKSSTQAAKYIAENSEGMTEEQVYEAFDIYNEAAQKAETDANKNGKSRYMTGAQLFRAYS